MLVMFVIECLDRLLTVMRCHQWHFSCVQHLIIAEHGLHVCLDEMQGGEDKTHD